MTQCFERCPHPHLWLPHNMDVSVRRNKCRCPRKQGKEPQARRASLEIKKALREGSE